MDIRTSICYAISRRIMRQPETRAVDYKAYHDWRHSSLSRSWSAFKGSNMDGKDILDFGCGDGQLSFFIGLQERPRKIVGIDINADAVERAISNLQNTNLPKNVEIEFTVGSAESIPLPARSFDIILAFDCLEHVMSPAQIFAEWFRVLRPGGRCLIEWFPYKGPWGPHMEALIPIPWAHVIFGEQAMFRAAEAIYDLPEFVPRHWDLDENGNKKPNKWRAWSSFADQSFINKLEVPTMRRLATKAGFIIDRFERRSFSGSLLRKNIGKALMWLPIVGEYFVSSTIIELRRPL